MNEIPIKTTCNAYQGEGVLATGKVFTLAGFLATGIGEYSRFISPLPVLSSNI